MLCYIIYNIYPYCCVRPQECAHSEGLQVTTTTTQWKYSEHPSCSAGPEAQTQARCGEPCPTTHVPAVLHRVCPSLSGCSSTAQAGTGEVKGCSVLGTARQEESCWGRAELTGLLSVGKL